MVLPVPINMLAQHDRFFKTHQPSPGQRKTSLPVPNPTPSFWLNSAPDANPLATHGSTGPLTAEADVVVIGSGITGVSAAYHLAKTFQGGGENKQIVVLEARDFCSGATGRNGGHLAEELFIWFAPDVAPASALTECALERHTITDVSRLIREHDWAKAIDLVEGGRFVLFFSPEEERDVRGRFDAAHAAGLDQSEVKWYSRHEMQQLHGIDFPAVHIPARNLWPLKLVTKFFNLASSFNGSTLTLHTRTPATQITHTGSGWTVQTPRGPIRTRYIIHATNGYAGHLLPHLTGPDGIVPVRGQVIATRASRTIAERESFLANEGFEYWFTRPVTTPPLVILGGGRETAGEYEVYNTDDGRVNGEIGKTLRRFLPSVQPDAFEKGRQPEMEWTGIMGFTQTGSPFVGPVTEQGRNSGQSNGQYVCAGYTGHGMPRAYACAEAVVGMIVADMRGQRWQQPNWLPSGYLTWNRA